MTMTITEFKSRFSLLDFVRSSQTGKSSTKFFVNCHIHEDSNPSLMIEEDHWRCFGCGAAGDSIDYLVTAGYASSISDALSKFGHVAYSLPKRDAAKEKQREYVLPSEHLIMQMHRSLLRSPELMRVLGDRGISIGSMIKYKLGYGYVPKTRLEKPRFSIPFYDKDGRVVTAKFRRHLGSEDEPKYLSYYGTTPFLYNVPTSIKSDTLVYCGGQFDAIILEQLGFHAIGPSSETMFRSEWTRFFEEKSTLVLLDNDEAGHLWTKKVCDVIPGAVAVSWQDSVPFGFDVSDVYTKMADGPTILRQMIGEKIASGRME